MDCNCGSGVPCPRHPMSQREALRRLTSYWYRYVVLDHHKDRDCHWRIEEVWSYGEDPTYTVTHDGYVHKDVVVKAKTYERARVILGETLIRALDRDLHPDEGEAEDPWLGTNWLPSVKQLAYEYDKDKPFIQKALGLPPLQEID